MKVIRNYEREVKKIQLGDRIRVGKYTATCVKAGSHETMFLLDQYLDNAFTHNNLLENMNEYIKKDDNFKDIITKTLILDELENGKQIRFRVPYAGEMFSGTSEDQWIHNKYWPDANDEFFDIWPCMKDRGNRIADREGCVYECGWLMNRTKWSSAYFVCVDDNGYTTYDGASSFFGVRPVFYIRREVGLQKSQNKQVLL